MKRISDQAYKRFQAMCEAAGIAPVEEVKEKWTPPEQEYYFDLQGNINAGPTTDLIRFGKARSTEALCKIASDRTIRANRISAWLDSEGSGEREHKEKTPSYYIYCDNGSWYASYGIYNYPDKVFMLKEDAIKLCEALNSGEFTL